MRIKKIRLAVAMAEQDMNFIKLSKACGVSRQTLSAINNGKSCKPDVAGKIARALGVDVTELIDEERS